MNDQTWYRHVNGQKKKNRQHLPYGQREEQTTQSDKRRRTDNTMGKRRRTDNTMGKRRRTDNTMGKRKSTKGQTTINNAYT